jgi:hypothetical protein
MGSGRWDTDAYTSATSTRRATGVADFAYSKTAEVIQEVHETLRPERINNKIMHILESRDSVDHPESLAVLVTFDVTGSNYARAVEAQKRLPALMDLLNKYVTDPQVAIAANDDFEVVGKNCIQISEFESDNRVDEHIRNTWLVSNGGGNRYESYELLVYLAARKIATDCYEVRGKKGYMFMYADEPFPTSVKKNQVKAVFDDVIQADIPVEDIINEALLKWKIFVMWPAGSSYTHARDQYIKLFGEDSVITLQDPNTICEVVAATVGLHEGQTDTSAIAKDLEAVGVTAGTAHKVTKSAKTATPAKSGKGAARL